MRSVVFSIVATLALAGSIHAQNSVPVEPAIPATGLTGDAPFILPDETVYPMNSTAAPYFNAWDRGPVPPQFTLGAEYLLWWVKNGPMPVSLLTAAPFNSPAFIPGALGNPDTVSVFHGLNYPVQSGARFTGRYWFGTARQFGLEGSYFFLANKTIQQSAMGGAGPKAPFLVNPFYDVAPGQNLESANYLSGPAFIAGGATLSSNTRFQGAELNAIANSWQSPNARLVLLGGFRYLRLDEGMTLATTQTDPLVIDFPGQFVNTLDQFSTRNNFYGGQLGGRLRLNRGRFFLATTAKVALGVNNEAVIVNGSTNTNTGPGFLTPIPTTTVPGGIYAQPTNISQQSHDRFAVVPEFTLQFGVNLTRHVSAFVGYNFLYISSVARPGNQIDRTINSTQLTSFTGVPTGPLAGPPRPSPHFQSSDFWAQGVNFGMQVQW